VGASARTAVGASGSHNTLEVHAVGTYINTLTLNVRKETFDGAAAHLLRLDPAHFQPKSGRPWCYLLDGSSPMVILRGVVERVGQSQRGEPLRVARLPAGLRPKLEMRFAALARQAADSGGHSSRLVTLTALPSGWIVAEAGPGDRDEAVVGSSIDLSAIRFSVGKGLSLIDEVYLHICDVAGTRLVCLQGTLGDRSFDMHGHRPSSTTS